jgi:hypothetical protein
MSHADDGCSTHIAARILQRLQRKVCAHPTDGSCIATDITALAASYIRYLFESGEVFEVIDAFFTDAPSGTLALQCPEKCKQLFALGRR